VGGYKKIDMLRSTGKQSRESSRKRRKRKKGGHGGKELRKKVLSLE